MKCPQCKTDLWCSCKHCKPLNVEMKKTLFLFEPDDMIKCSNCGYSEYIDQWEDRDLNETIERLRKEGK